MPSHFVNRFIAAIALILILFAVIIHFFFANDTTISWIFAMPVILAVPIISAVALSKDAELGVPATK